MLNASLRLLDLHDAEQAQPKHERLKDYLLAELAAGRLRSGQALPTEVQLSRLLRVARSTVRQALAAMERQGLVRRERGRGTFIDEQARQRLRPGLDAFALLTPETQDGFQNGFYPSLLHGFETGCKEVRNQVFVCNTEDDIKVQSDIILQLLDKDVAGVAMVPTDGVQTPAYQIRQLQQRGVPVVFCHRRVEGVKAPLLPIKFHEVGRLAGEALVERGHRRVAFFSYYPSTSTAAYEAGLREAMRSKGGDLPQEFVFFSDGSSLSDPAQREETVLQSLRQMCRAADPPTGIFATYGPLAELIYLMLGRLGLKVPGDISLISEGAPRREGPIARLLTSVVVDEIGIGQRAAEILHEMRCGDRPLNDDEEIVIPLEVAQGETLASI